MERAVDALGRRNKTMITVDPEKDKITYNKALSLIDDLGYISYRHNRRISPLVEPKGWVCIFGAEKVERYEERYQEEVFYASL